LERLFDEFPVPDTRAASAARGSAAARGRVVMRFTVALWVTVAALLAGSVAALITLADKPPTAGQVVSRVRAFVNAHPSATFTGNLRAEAADTPGSSSSSVLRFRVEGVSRQPDRARLIATASQGASEIIAIEGKQFVRQAASQSALAQEKYAEVRPNTSDARNGVVGGQRSLSDNADRLSAPNGIGQLLAAAGSPVLISHVKGVNVVKATLSPGKAFGSLGSSIKDARLTLTAHDDGTLDRTSMTLVNSQATVDIDYRWSKWGENVVIEVPAAGLIDATPGIAEEKVAAFKDTALFQPQSLPKGWVLDGADVLAKGDTVEGCPEVQIDYTDPANADSGYLTMFELAAGCANPAPPSGAQPFVAGPYRGFVRVDAGESDAQFLVGRTVVQVQSDLTPAQLAQVMAHLAPLNLAKAPLPISGLGNGTNA
jgi:hypothetical protein